MQKIRFSGYYEGSNVKSLVVSTDGALLHEGKLRNLTDHKARDAGSSCVSSLVKGTSNLFYAEIHFICHVCIPRRRRRVSTVLESIRFGTEGDYGMRLKFINKDYTVGRRLLRHKVAEHRRSVFRCSTWSSVLAF